MIGAEPGDRLFEVVSGDMLHEIDRATTGLLSVVIKKFFFCNRDASHPRNVRRPDDVIASVPSYDGDGALGAGD